MCSSNKLSKEEFLTRSRNLHENKYDYSCVNFVNTDTSVSIICPEHGMFLQKPSKHLSGHGCPKCGIKKSHEKQKMSQLSFLEKCKNIQEENPNISFTNVIYKSMKEKITLYCKKIDCYGNEHGKFKILPYNLLNGQLCPKCKYEKISLKNSSNTIDFIKKARKVHGDKYDYSKVEYVNAHTKVCIICPIHGEFWQKPNNHLIGYSCKQCANEITASKNENEIKKFLKDFYFGILKTNNRNLLKKFELDIFAPDKNIAIEYDGLYWHSNLKKDKNYHLNKTELCEKLGVRLIHIFEDEWIYKQDIVKSKLKHIFGYIENQINSEVCLLKDVNTKLSNIFLEENDIQGKCRCDRRIGLFYNDKLIQLMCIKGNEIIRNCSLLNTFIIGGTERLLDEINTDEIVIKLDRRWEDGNDYIDLGFKVIGYEKPDYTYVIHDKRSRKKLNNRQYRIYDVGKIKMKLFKI